MCLYSPEEPVGSTCVRAGQACGELPGKTVIMNEKKRAKVWTYVKNASRLSPSVFLSQHRLSSLSSRMGWTFSRTVSPDCRIISTISSLFLFSTFRPFISTSRSPGTKPRARSLVPAPGSAKWTTRRYNPSISATVQHCGAPQGEPKIPSVPPLKNQLPNFRCLRWHDSRQAEVCWKHLIHNLRNLHLFSSRRLLLMMLKTWLTLGVKDLGFYLWRWGQAEFCPEGVEPSDGLSSLFLWEKEKRFMMEPICEFCMARGAEPGRPLLDRAPVPSWL